MDKLTSQQEGTLVVGPDNYASHVWMASLKYALLWRTEKGTVMLILIIRQFVRLQIWTLIQKSNKFVAGSARL